MAKQDILTHTTVSKYLTKQDQQLVKDLIVQYRYDMLTDFLSGIYYERVQEDEVCKKGDYTDVLKFYCELLAPYYTEGQVTDLMAVGGYLWVRWLTFKKESAHMIESSNNTINSGGYTYYYELVKTEDNITIPHTNMEDSLEYIKYILYKEGA